LPCTATLAEIRKAYRQNALRHHPDKDKTQDATALFQRIVEAYEVLSSVRTRLLYDAEERNFASNEIEKLRVAEDQERDHAIARERLVEACRARDSWQVMKLLRGGFANINGWDKYGKTPLIHAADTKATQVVSILILYHADVNIASSDGWTPIMFTINEDHSSSAQEQASCMQGLLNAQADANVKSKTGMTALQLACAHDNLNAVQSLLAHSANPNIAGDNGMTPLALASEGGHEAIARALLEVGASVGVPDLDGTTPLMYAAALAHEDLVALLLEAKADASATSVIGCDALHMTSQSSSNASFGRVSVVTNLLIAAQANPCSSEEERANIIDLAAGCG